MFVGSLDPSSRTLPSMPYDPTPVGPDAAPGGRPATLTVQIQGGGAPDGAPEPETVLVLDPPAGGRVRVREYPSPGAPVAYEAGAADVLARVEGAARAGRRVGAELLAVRRWLAGPG
jgi:hypothetical protein